MRSLLLLTCILMQLVHSTSYLSSSATAQPLRLHADFGRYPIQKRTTALRSTQTDRLVAGTSCLTLLSSSVVIWSEASVILSGCGPLQLSDTIERACYLMVLSVASICWFCRLAFQRSVDGIILEQQTADAAIQPEILTQLIRIAEAFCYIAVLGAVLALLVQVLNGAQMDGLSGIDVQLCQTRLSFDALYR
jgi:hypothetical protein